MPKLDQFEIGILREVAGERPARSWGAAVAEALSFLKGKGLVTTSMGASFLTSAGRAYLDSLKGASDAE